MARERGGGSCRRARPGVAPSTEQSGGHRGPGCRGSRPAGVGGRLLQPDRGSGTVLTLALIGAVVASLIIAQAVVIAVLAAGRARTAADLGAIAAAGAFASGQSAPAACRAGGTIVTRNDATQRRCSVSASGVSIIETRVVVRLPLLGLRQVAASARAGPSLIG